VIKNLKEPELRKAYDAPKWLPTHRPVKFGELATMDSLQVSGLTPDLIRINMRVAPDLFTWQRDGVPIDLRYRFTPRPTVDKSTLNIGINDGFVRALSLSGADIEKGKIKESVLLFFKEGHRYAQEEVQVPTFRIGAENQLQFHFFTTIRSRAHVKTCIWTMCVRQSTLIPRSIFRIFRITHLSRILLS
jgi:hypothetical protein